MRNSAFACKSQMYYYWCNNSAAEDAALKDAIFIGATAVKGGFINFWTKTMKIPLLSLLVDHLKPNFNGSKQRGDVLFSTKYATDWLRFV